MLKNSELAAIRDQLRDPQGVGVNRILRIIQNLYNSEISYDSLSCTKISNTIVSLSKYKGFENQSDCQRVNKMCSKLIEKWKKSFAGIKQQAEEQKDQNEISKDKEAVKSIGKPQIGSDMKKTEDKKKMVNEPVLLKMNNEQPQYSTQERDTLPKFKSEIRTRALKAIDKVFKSVRNKFDISNKEWVSLIVRMELAIYQRDEELMNYKSHIKEVLSMLSLQDTLMDVISKLLSKQISLYDVAEAKSEAFLSEEQKFAIRRAQEKQLGLVPSNEN